jgi:hypothetical protein
MEVFKRFSPSVLIERFGHGIRRFPVAVLLLVFLTVYLMSLINHDDGPVSEKWNFFFIFFPATGALLAVSLQLLTEDFKHRLTAIVTQVLVLALWLGVSLYLTQFERFSMQQLVGVSATVVTMVLSLFLLCFYRKDDDVPFWNFAQRLFVAITAGVVVSGILTLGIILFVQSLDWLFGMEVNGWFLYIPTFCMVLLAPLLAMSQIPEGEQKHIRRIAPYTGFIKGVSQYLFIPLLLLYIATLYVYAAKILITWQLPVGWVCYLVSASMLGMVILIFITFPLQYEQGNSFFKRLMRCLPLAMLPLLVLMSVAIGRRLSDYGITVSRLYVVVFNLWCYVVCIGLLLSRNRRIWWVPASFAVVLLLISVGPWSIPNVTEHRLQAEVREAFASSGVKKLPLTGTQYEKWLKTADEKLVRSVDSKLFYLQTDYGYESTNALVEDDAIVGSMDRIQVDRENNITQEGHDMHFYNHEGNLMTHVEVPQGYTHMECVDNVMLVDEQGNQLVFEASIILNDEEKKYRFEASLNQFVKRDHDRNNDERVEPLILDNGTAALVVDYFTLTIHNNTLDYYSVSGILFTK